MAVRLRWAMGHVVRLDWRRELIYLLMAAMEVAWLTPWYLALTPAAAQLPPERTALGLLAIMIIPTYTARLLVRLRLKPKIQGAVLAILLALNCVLAVRVFLYAGQGHAGFDWLGETLKDALDMYRVIPGWFIVVLSTLILWWRGTSLGQRRPSVRAVALGFYVGIVSFIGFVLIVSLVTQEDPLGFIPAFFFFSLMALAVARMDEMRGRRGAMRSPFGFSWLLSVALAALILVLLGMLLGALLTGQDFRSMVRWIYPLFLLVGIVLGLCSLVLRHVVDLGLGFLRSLGVEADITPLFELLEDLRNLVPEGSEVAIKAPPGLGVVRLLLMAGLVVGMGALVVLMVRHQSWRNWEQDGEDQESTFSRALFLDNLRQWVRSGRGRFATALGLVERSGLRGLFAALTIRRIYAQMQRLAEMQGFPRAASDTPYEYERAAMRAFPDATAEVQRITEAYVAVHYGEAPETDTELQAIRASWERLKESLRTKSVELP